MPTLLLVTHERLGHWARQLRPRIVSTPFGDLGPIRHVETRTVDDLIPAIRGIASPVIVIDLADRPRPMLEALSAAARISPDGLFLVLDPGKRPGVALLARELGATVTLSGVVPPPSVASMVARLIRLSHNRSSTDGWSRPVEPIPEPWEDLLDLELAPDRQPTVSIQPTKF